MDVDECKSSSHSRFVSRVSHSRATLYRIIAAQEQAEKKLAEQKAGFEYSKAVIELAEAVAQLRAIQQLRNRKS